MSAGDRHTDHPEEQGNTAGIDTQTGSGDAPEPGRVERYVIAAVRRQDCAAMSTNAPQLSDGNG